MALIIAAAVVVALVTPEASNVHPGDYALRPARSLAPRWQSHGVSAPPPLRALPQAGFTDGFERADQYITARHADPAEPLDYRKQIALLPALPSPHVARAEAPRGGPDIVAKHASTLAALRACESGGDYTINTGNGYYGAYQWLPSTWRSVGGVGMPHEASPAEQDYRAALMLEAGRRGEWGC